MVEVSKKMDPADGLVAGTETVWAYEVDLCSRVWSQIA